MARILIRLICLFIPMRDKRRAFRARMKARVTPWSLRIRGRRLWAHTHFDAILKKIANSLAEGEKVKVGFVILSNMTNRYWVPLFKRFLDDERFDPYLIVSPYNYASVEYLTATVEKMVCELQKVTDRIIIGYNPKINGSVDIRKMFKGGVLFLQDPYVWLSHPWLQIRNLLESLTFYIPYSYCIVNRDNAFEMDGLAQVYRIFPETKMHEELHRKYGILRGNNVTPFMGYLGVHALLNVGRSDYLWRCPRGGMKKLILAPHHVLGLGNILAFADFYVELARKYVDRISFVFKPHPYLKEDLMKYWSKSKINACNSSESR